MQSRLAVQQHHHRPAVLTAALLSRFAPPRPGCASSSPRLRRPLTPPAMATPTTTSTPSFPGPAPGTTLAQFVADQCAAGPQPGDGPASPTPSDAADLVVLLDAIATATSDIAARLASAGLDGLLGAAADAAVAGSGGTVVPERDAPKALDVVSNEIFKAALAATGIVGVLASEEDDEAVAVPNHSLRSNKYVAVFDPLDGSSNLASSLPTGTIWGLYRATGPAPNPSDALQPGRALVAAGYALYSSATVAVLSLGLGRGAHAFTRCPRTGAWRCSSGVEGVRVPARGQTYSLNDARAADWPPALAAYITAIRSGTGRSGKKYAARYVCALVADLHRTLAGGVGGWAANPRPHLRRVYEAAPLAFVTVAAGGAATDGAGPVLDTVPDALHARAPLWLGSRDDIEELLSYGEVRQGVTKYEV